ncbi:Glutaredoxin-C6 [Chionoecetes opilio]|uniref:Glutaredoxin-C6 n=1 Tax=Chionoecetes opilio TaxID=41210 RepID=A0A8J4YFI4_CHIOP|nr:Glutaredoxin-C6 [Chionoecetes opilio]
MAFIGSFHVSSKFCPAHQALHSVGDSEPLVEYLSAAEGLEQWEWCGRGGRQTFNKTLLWIDYRQLSSCSAGDNYITSNKVIICSKSFCSFCHKVKDLFNELNVPFEALELDLIDNGSELQSALLAKSGQRTVPNVYISGEHVGGASDTFSAHERGDLMKLVN